MPRRKKKLKIKTVIHRARPYVNDGNKTEAINSVLRNTDYTTREAEALVEFIGAFFEVESDRSIVTRWCDEHRMSGFVCRDQHPPEAEEPTAASAAAVPFAEFHGSNCPCGRAECDNEWHRLAIWIRGNPQEWYRFLEELDQQMHK